MNAFWRPNVVIEKVERAGAIDRYGASQLETIAIDIKGRLERVTRRVKDISGVTTTIDGTILLSPKDRLSEGDKLTLENQEQWIVYNEDEALDAIEGKAEFYIYGLTKQRERS